MHRSAPKLGTPSDPTVWLGVNYWSKAGGPRMWRDYDPALVRAELAQLRDLNMTTTRSFCYWPDFMPTPYSLDEDVLDRFADFLAAHEELGMATIPSFIVGHMSGQNWDPAWREGRSVFGDVWFVARQAWYVREVSARFADHPAIAGWLLSNEIPIYGDWKHRGIGTLNADEVSSWAQLLIDANRAAGARQPISIGDGSWGVEVTGLDNGFRARDLSKLVDFAGPHVYRMETDQVRQWLGAAFICELCHWDDKPVIMEEFGVTTDYVSDENAGHYYRQVLNNTLLAGATGWWCWNNVDYDDLYDVEPYSHHPHEMHFGIIDTHGVPKAPALEMKAFGDLLAAVDFAHVTRPDAEVALVISSYLEAQYPFTYDDDATAVFRNSMQAYIASRESDVPMEVVREYDGIPEGAKLYVLPSVKQLTSPSWRQLAELAEGGAMVYGSVFLGTHQVQRGPWWPDFDDYFGVRRLTRYGLTDEVDEQVTFRFERDFGAIKAGEELHFKSGGTENSRAMIPVEATTGEVIAVDQQGRPAIVRNARGAGSMVLVTYPVEHFASANRAINPEDTWRLYDALADEAGVTRGVRVADGRVSVAEMSHADGSRLVWCVNLSPDTVHAEIITNDRLTDLDGSVLTGVELAPFAVEVLRIID